MYREQIRVHKKAQARALNIDRQKHVIRSLLIGTVLTALIIFTINISHVKAAPYSVKDSYQYLVKDRQVHTLGYQVAWTKDLTGMAESAYKQDEFVLARRVWQILAEAGDTKAAFKLAMLYDAGAYGVEQDSTMAAHWYLQAAKAGHLHAMHNLAVAYANGEGVEMDISKAMEWWQRAAKVGNSDSQYNLGILYAMGTYGVKKNLDKAKKWWRKAAVKGDPMAQYNLGTIYANGEGLVRSYCEAMRWWEKSANSGVRQASWALAVIKTRQDFHACW
ncbi:MAG: tetratricopeptide repeat protein [Thioalkalispiraceae bacterium]|jgi:TPR repeat protein